MSEHEINHQLHEIERKLDDIMGDLTALNASIATLTTNVDTLIADFQAESDQAAIDQATTNVDNLNAAVVTAITPAPKAPTVTGLSPTTGAVAGGVSVIVTGTGFTGATAVDFGASAPAASFSVDSDTQITAVSPAAALAGPVDVIVTTPAGTSATSPADVYTTS